MNETNQGGEAAPETAELGEFQAYFDTQGESPVESEKPNGEAAADQPAEAVAPEGEQPPTDGQPARDEKGRFVPHQALHAEREERKKAQQERDELLAFKAAMEERVRWYEAATKPQEETPEPPDPEKDVFAALKYERERREDLERKIAERANEEARRGEMQQAERQVWTAWHEDANSYVQQNPDFGNAAKWLSDFRDSQLKAFAAVNPQFANQQARNQQIEAELKAIVVEARKQGKSSAELVYQIAQGYGYKPAQAANGGEAAARLSQIDKAQQASRTVANAPGNAGGQELSLETVMSMPKPEFETWIADPKNERLFNRLMGA